jgi:hypothetical protein
MTMDARCKIHHVDERCCFATRDDVRSVTVSLGMIMRSRVAGKSFDDVFAGSKWLVTQREGGPRAGEHDALDGLLRTVNAQLDSYATSSAAAR